MYRNLTILATILLLTTTQANALVLIDAQKRVIGEVTDARMEEPAGFVAVARHQGDATFLLLCSRQECFADAVVEYANEDCTGEAGIRVFPEENEEYVLWKAAIAPPLQTIYMTRKSPRQPAQRKTMLSFWYEEGKSCIPHDTPHAELYSPVFTVGPLTFTPPLRIQTPRDTAGRR